jgi:hypothetical protein
MDGKWMVFGVGSEVVTDDVGRRAEIISDYGVFYYC